MAFRIQLRRDTSTKWSINNPTLLSGEMGYETDTSYLKVGDGTTDWNNLTYWTGGSAGSVSVKRDNVLTVSPVNYLNFSTDFSVTDAGSGQANVGISNNYSGTFSIFGDNNTGITGATGAYFRGFSVSASNKYATVSNSSYPYYSVTVNLSGGSISSIASSFGPDGYPLTGGTWNYSLSRNGNNLTVTHNTGNKPMALCTRGTNASNVFVKSPVGTSTSSFTLATDTSDNSFTVYGINSANTGADNSSSVEVTWIFGIN